MIEDVRIFKQHGVRGIVIGLLTREGKVDTERTKMYVDSEPRDGTQDVQDSQTGGRGFTVGRYVFHEMYSLSSVRPLTFPIVCFHRAFDMTRDVHEGDGLATLIRTHRVLIFRGSIS